MLRWVEVIVAALMVGFFLGYIEGKSSTKNTVIAAQKNQMAAADLASTKEAQRLVAEAMNADLAKKLEDAANAQVPTAQCLPVDRVMRLNQR